ncbi:MAG: hypothetical protein JWP35_1310 [Caulobacter sp.]|nr:hypothetical protein [Caulobacter sp.]
MSVETQRFGLNFRGVLEASWEALRRHGLVLIVLLPALYGAMTWLWSRMPFMSAPPHLQTAWQQVLTWAVAVLQTGLFAGLAAAPVLLEGRSARARTQGAVVAIFTALPALIAYGAVINFPTGLRSFINAMLAAQVMSGQTSVDQVSLTFAAIAFISQMLGVLFAVVWGPAAAAAVTERLGPARALTRGAELTKGSRAVILGVLVLVILAYIPSGAVSFLLRNGADFALARYVLRLVTGSVLAIVWMAVCAVIYREVVRGRVSLDGQDVAEAFD